ncbi:MAG: hypothetical protein AUG51_23585 [Acidobacteria bacterium 13_1_20CM_3_53_8]|nr:MAG: hypothetical protein AUG51_23585 [Acidobacteria bacterium 13_1_20CM_3_53_8]
MKSRSNFSAAVIILAFFILMAMMYGTSAQVGHDVDEIGSDGDRLLEQESYWATRVSYPTGQFDPAWVRKAAEQDARIRRAIPAGRVNPKLSRSVSPLALNPSGFTALGPQPEHMTGCTGCFDYTDTEGRVNSIAVDPTTTTNGSIVAYIGTVGGGVWKTTNCCGAGTTWTSLTDGAAISTTSVDSVTVDPNNHNTIYAATGDLNYGSFSMGSQGIMKSTDGGANWTVLGASIFGAALPEPAGQFPQYQAVGKVRVDPNNSNNVVAGTKTGLYLSYDGGTNWTGPCLTNTFNTQRQDITGLDLTNIGGTTRILAAVGTRGFATTVQYNLDQNGANGLYKGTMPASGCPSDFALITSNANGFVFGTTVSGSPYATGNLLNAGTGTPYGGNISTGNQLGRMDIAVAPSNTNYIYAQVGSIAANNNSGCGNTSGCQLGVWASTDGGANWSFMTGSAGGSLRNCLGTNTSGNPGDYPQNWYDQGMAVDPNNPDRLFIDTYDTWLASRTGTSFYNVTCGYNGGSAANHVVHVDHHALAFVPGSSSILLEGSDGGIFGSTNADTAVSGTTRNTWVNMDTGVNTIEFYSGDISGNFATSASPQAVGGAQDNGPSSVTFAGSPTGPAQWQMGLGGDGFYARIDPVGTGTSLRFFEGNNSGGLSRCTSNCTASGASWTSIRPSWTGDTQSFILPYDIFHGGIAGGDDCLPATATTGCGHLIAGTTRVWETISGAAASGVSSTWYVTNNPSTQNMTKQTLGNRSFINQVKYSPKFQSVAIVGTNDANVWIGFSLGTGLANQANWVDVTSSNTVLPNRPVLGIALDPTVAAANIPVGYAAVGGFDQNTPSTPGHLFQVTCTANCGSFTWLDKSGNLPNIPVDSVIVNPNFPQQVFAGTDFGLYYTDDITAATPVWNRFNNGLPNVMIWDMQIDRGATTLSLWTRSRGAYAWPLPFGPVPTAAPATIGGRVVTADGRPLGGVTLNLSGGKSDRTITDSSGNYRFDSVATDNFYTVTPALPNFSFSPASRSFSLLTNKTDATFTATQESIVTTNPLDTDLYFVRQQYLDFLGREPDQGGLNYWSNQLRACGSDADCIRKERINISAAFFMSEEFQQTGSFVYRLYKASYGRTPTFAEFSADRTRVVDGENLNARKQALADEWVTRASFKQAYPDSLSAADFVNRLYDSLGVGVSSAERQQQIDAMQAGKSRSQVLRDAIEVQAFRDQEYNHSFVLMQYFGYLKRDADNGGLNFWLDVLNNRVPGNYRSMVCAFLTSSEYQRRFSSVITRSNFECGQ